MNDSRLPSEAAWALACECLTLVLEYNYMSRLARRLQTASNLSETPGVSIAYRSSAVSTPGNGTSFTVAIPGSVQLSDGLIMVVSSSTTTMSADPTGWTATSAGTIQRGSLYCRVLTRVAQTGDAGKVVTVTFNSINKASLAVVAYSNILGSAASDKFIDTLATATDTSTATHVAPAITTTLGGDWVVSIATDKTSIGTPTSAWTVPRDEVRRAAVYGATGGTSIAVADTAASVAIGAVSAKTFTSDQAQTNGITWTLALKAGDGSSSGGGGNGETGTWVGGYRAINGDTGTSAWQAASTAHGPWTVARNFPWPQGIYASLTGKMSPDLLSLGKIPWPSLSLTGSGIWASVAAGDYDSELEQLAAWFPTDSPCYLTFQHEWEHHQECGTPTDYANMYRHVYPLMKAINPNLKIVPISFIWQWDQTSTAEHDAGFPGVDYCDGLACDTYWYSWQGKPKSMLQYGDFANWYSWASTKGLPLHITEWGYYTTGDNSRGDAITEFGNWAIDHGFESLQYWDSNTGNGGTPGTGDWNVDGDQHAIDALKALAERGRKLA